MKILQVSHKYPFPPKDGGTIAVINLAQSLAQFGNEVTLLAMCTPKHGNINPEEATSFYRQLLTVYVDTTIKPLKLFFNLLFSKLPYNAQRFISNDFKKRLIGLITHEKFDIIQLEGLYLMPYASEIRKYTRVPVVLRSHNIEHEIWKRITANTHNLLKYAYLRILARRLRAFELSYINQYDMLVTMSERDQLIYSGMGNVKPCHVMPVTVHLPSLNKGYHTTYKKGLFFIGSLDYMPNQEGVIWFIEKVWKKYFQNRKDIQFHIAGRNAPENLKKYFRQQPVMYFGEIDDAKQFMLEGGIMVSPVFSGSGIRVKIIEAMGYGIPVVSTSIGAEGLDVTNTINIMIADNPEEFANAVNKLLENQSFFAKIGENAKKYISEKMDSHKLTKDLLTFYQKNL